MPYNANIPQPTDIISSSQVDILGNFQSINTVFNVNHLDFNAPSAGKHNVVEFPAPTTFAGTAAGEVALYSVISTLSGAPELVLQKQSGGPAYEFSSAGTSASGWTRLPSGILLKWGNYATVPGANTLAFPVAANIPVFSAIYQVLITTKIAGASDTYVLLNSFTVTDMTVYSSGRTTVGAAVSGFTYLAIGL